MKVVSRLPLLKRLRFTDARLPSHWKLTRLTDDSILVEFQPEPIKKLLLSPALIGIALFMTYHTVLSFRYLPSISLLIGFLFGGIGLLGMHFLFSRERWKIRENSLVVQRSSLWRYHLSQYTDATLRLTKTEMEDRESWTLEIVAGQQKNWLVMDDTGSRVDNASDAYPPQLTDVGKFLHQYTGWPFILP